MDTVVFGRTGIRVSVAGLGCGGHSRLGQSYGASADDSVRLVRRALDLGVNYIDTADAYGTEEIVGEAVRGDRDRVVISTKISPRNRDGELLDAAGLRAAVQTSLEKLGHRLDRRVPPSWCGRRRICRVRCPSSFRSWNDCVTKG